MAGFDYTTAGPPTIPAPSSPAHCYDFVNDVLYTSSRPSPSEPAMWVVVGANALQLQGRSVSGNAPSNGEAIVWNAVNQDWEPGIVAGAIIGSPSLDTQVVGNGSAFVPQTKPVYDVRDWMTCDGVTNASSGMHSLLTAIGSNAATIAFTSGTCVLGNITFPANVTLDFSQGGSIQPITDHTPPGNAAFVQGGGTANPAASPTNSCSVTLSNTTAGNSIVFMMMQYDAFAPDNLTTSTPTDTGNNYYNPVQTTTYNRAGYILSWVASGISGGTVTITAQISGSTKNACIAHEYSGLGLAANLDGTGAFGYGSTTPFASGSATTTSGSLLIGYGGDPNDAQTCTAGTGFTQPAGSAGNVSGTNGTSLCAQYELSSPGGSVSASQNFSNSPVLSSWVYGLIALKPGSAIIRILGGIHNPALNHIFYNASPGQGTIDFTGANILQNVYPEWWGASPSASASVNTPALQAAIYGAFGQKRTNGSGLFKYNRPLYLNGNYQINGELKWYDILNFKVVCNGRLNGGITQTAANSRIMDGQSVAYGAFYDCSWSGTASSTAPLLDIDYNGVTTAGDLAPQFIDFYNNSFSGSNAVDSGVLIAKSGSAAQGSNIDFFDCSAQGFTGSAYQVGGNDTGRNVGRFYAQNALAISWWNGDIQSCPTYGISVYGGGYLTIYGMSFEDNFQGQATGNVLGYDVYGEGTQGPVVMEHVRSESRKLIAGSTIQVKDCATQNQAQYPTPGQTFPVGSVMTGSSVGGDGAYYQVTVDGLPGFAGVGTPTSPETATSGSSTTVVNSGASYTTNAFVGMRVSILSGTNIGCYATITGNSATTITASGGWVTDYDKLYCTAPDSTSTYVVEPSWNLGTITSGGMTMVALNENGINGTSGNAFSGRVEDTFVPGGRIKPEASFSTLRNVVTTLVGTNWFDDGGNINYQGPSLIRNWEVASDSAAYLNLATGKFFKKLSLPTTSPGSSYSGGTFQNVGTKPYVWSVAQLGLSPKTAKDVWIGGRSDPGAGGSTSRNILETGGTLGRPSPIGVNINGTDMDIAGGLPSGSGTPGNINFWIGNSGSSGASIIDGTKVARINTSGQIESLVSTGTAPLAVASTTQVSNLNVSQLEGKTWEAPGTIGSTTPNTVTGTTINYTTALQHNGTALQSSDLSDGSSLAKIIASGTSVLGTSNISATSCAAAVTTSATGTASTDSIEWAFNAAPGTGYTSGLTILPYVTANNVNFLVCNPSAGTLTPAAATVNWRVLR